MKRFFCLALFWICMLCVLSSAAAQNVVSLRKGYELLTKASDGYPDSGEKLTNGKYGTPVDNGSTKYYYRDPEFVGFHRNDTDADGTFVILLDLGEVLNELSDFEVGYLNETDVGIYAPSKISFSISDTRDGDYTPVGDITLSEPTSAGQQHAGIATVTAPQMASGQYVRCVITPGSYSDAQGQTVTAAWTFIDEIQVLQGRNSTSGPESSAGTSDSASSPAASNVTTPPTGDRALVSLVLIAGASSLAVAALIGRRRA